MPSMSEASTHPGIPITPPNTAPTKLNNTTEKRENLGLEEDIIGGSVGSSDIETQ